MSERSELHVSSVGRRAFLRCGVLGVGAALLAACAPRRSPTAVTPPSRNDGGGDAGTTASTSVASLPGFDAFASAVRVFRRGDYWMVESTGMPAHSMMVGIRSWQQQVPVPQPYIADNAWRLPVRPTLAEHPVSARTQLYRGAIAIAIDGVPIFNALNNRGDDAYLAGELDQWGGHAGRADDYHYHVAPLHLQPAAGPGRPIAYALDGFAIYGSAEPDGGPLAPLDELNGHLGADGTYHYHGTTTYPYINGGLRGVVTVAGDQIDPQPVTRPFRPDGRPLRGATITGFDVIGSGRYHLTYDLGGTALGVDYTVTDTTVSFVFTDAEGGTRAETYQRRP